MGPNIIMDCTMAKCAYNAGGMCHTPAITMGPRAECATLVFSVPKAGYKVIISSVGSCQAADCTFNHHLECEASQVKISGSERHADCATFCARIPLVEVREPAYSGMR